MSRFEMTVEAWHALADSSWQPETALASLSIQSDSKKITQVYDASALTVRDYIYVPVLPLVKWLIINWWRLRWEPHGRSLDWRMAHSMAAIGGGIAWPPLELYSDGEFIQIRMDAESEADAAAIRYLSTVTQDVPATDFESAVDRLVDQVLQRFDAIERPDPELHDLWLELLEERRDPSIARECQLQALAGIQPGLAPAAWLKEVGQLSSLVGPHALDEVMAILPSLDGNVSEARSEIKSIQDARMKVDLTWVTPELGYLNFELPWQKASRIASKVRHDLDLQDGPLPDKVLEELLGARLSSPQVTRRPIEGGFRLNRRHTAVLNPRVRRDNQRFYFSRLIGCAFVSREDDSLLPITDAATATQKFERAFAQELLCPWTSLDQFTNKHGIDQEGVARAARYFKVSEMLVLSTLVNRGKLRRERLAQFA